MPSIRADSDPSSGHPHPAAPSFIGSAFEGTGRGRIRALGYLDADAVDRLAALLQGFVDAGVRFVTVDARDVVRADPALVPMLGRFQRRLTCRHGLLTITGLHPTALDTAGPTAAGGHR